MTPMSGVDTQSTPANVVPGRRRRARWRWSRPEGDDPRGRLRLAAAVFALAYLVIVGRLVMFGLTDTAGGNAAVDPNAAIATSRPDLVDRNGEILATDIKMASLYAEPRKIIDPDEAAELITSVLPELDTRLLRKKLAGNAGFAWVKREITPTQQQQIHALGIPGIGFLTENRRFYPGGPLASHIVGLVNVDNQGIAGFEKYVDDHWLGDLHEVGFGRGHGMEPVKLSIDVRVQHIVRDELASAMEEFRAIAATGVVLNVHTGEVMAMASLPDFDPNDPVDALKPDRLNRMTAGVYELGSVFKSFTFALALDSGAVSLGDRIDASHPIHFGHFTINDYHAKHRVLTVPEVFIYSSNIGAAHMALKAGPEVQQEYLKRFGMFDRIQTDLPETAEPLVPKKWSELTTMTVAFGHGLAVTPLQVAVADAALVNGGLLIPPTFEPRTAAKAAKLAKRVVKPLTSDQLRYLFRLNVEKGSGRHAAVPGYNVGGKTGTAEKVVNGRYASNQRLNSFLAAFPIDDPQYVVLVVLDDPKATKTAGTTAGWNAAPTVAAIIRRSAALLGVEPRPDDGVAALLVSN
jgi:cell division protein FtsI (penicillin-binding protein 3)